MNHPRVFMWQSLNGFSGIITYNSCSSYCLVSICQKAKLIEKIFTPFSILSFVDPTKNSQFQFYREKKIYKNEIIILFYFLRSSITNSNDSTDPPHETHSSSRECLSNIDCWLIFLFCFLRPSFLGSTLAFIIEGFRLVSFAMDIILISVTDMMFI